MNAYQQDREWEGSYHDQVLSILNTRIHHLVRLEVASFHKDAKQATDFTVNIHCPDIAVRLRRSSYQQRDWTIRSRRANGARTELAKILEGYASHYFYGWVNEIGDIAEWILIDLQGVRDSRILERGWKEYENRNREGNPDGTYFVFIPVLDLLDTGCLIDWKCTALPRREYLEVLEDRAKYHTTWVHRTSLEIELNVIQMTLDYQEWWDNHPEGRTKWEQGPLKDDYEQCDEEYTL